MVRAVIDFPGIETQEEQADMLLESLSTSLFAQLGTALCHVEETIVRNMFAFAGQGWRAQVAPAGSLICERVEALAVECGYAARVHQGATDWLWDKTWFKMRATQAVIQPTYPALIRERASAWAKVEGLKLVCEAEWKPDLDEILKDFLKLVFVEAEIRLFVYQYQHPSRLNSQLTNKTSIADICREVVPITNRKRFLLIGFTQYPPHKFQVDSFVI
jgi:hypothetical protein